MGIWTHGRTGPGERLSSYCGHMGEQKACGVARSEASFGQDEAYLVYQATDGWVTGIRDSRSMDARMNKNIVWADGTRIDMSIITRTQE